MTYRINQRDELSRACHHLPCSSRRWILAGWLFILSVIPQLTAQITLEVKPVRSLYLAHEEIWVKLHVTNFSGRTLQFEKNSNWIDCFVESLDGYIIQKHRTVTVDEDVVIPNAKKAVITLNIEPYFELSRAGRFHLTALARIPDWNQEVRSPLVQFDIGNGVAIWSQKFGVSVAPSSSEASLPPEIRQYTLLQYTQLDKMVLYLQLSNESGSEVFRVFPIGKTVSFWSLNPQKPVVDSLGRLHVLHQFDAKLLSYQVFDHQGDLVQRETYQIHQGSKPRFELNERGEIGVLGGIRVQNPADNHPSTR